MFLFSSSHIPHRLSLTRYDTLQYTCSHRTITVLLWEMLCCLSVRPSVSYNVAALWHFERRWQEHLLALWKAHRSLYIQTFINPTFCPDIVFMCFVWIWEQTAVITLYSIKLLVFVTQTQCVYFAVRTGYRWFSQTVVGRRRHFECTHIDICEIFVAMSN